MIAPYTQPELPDQRVFTEQLAASPMTEAELLDLMRKHCQKSWQATRWLLEMQFPQRYGKRKANADSKPNLAAFLSALGNVLAEEIADEALRGRIAARLEALAAAEPGYDKPPHAAASKPNYPIAVKPQPIKTGEPGEHPGQQENRPPQQDPPASNLQSPATAAAASSAVEQPLTGDAPPPAPNPARTQDTRQAALDSPRPPSTWMERARQQNEEKKRLRKQRNQMRAQQTRLRSHATRGKK
jgi:hypothetical protein